MPPSAADRIADAIDAAGGALRFDRFMGLALYGEDGFYAAGSVRGGGQAGRRGDFITSAEVGPLFGAVLARYLDSVWDELGHPERFTVVEAGAGPGTLARSIRNARPRCSPALDYVAVEISAAQRDAHPEGIDSRADMPTEPVTGVVLANELLDNLPFRLAVMDGDWCEAYVTQTNDGRLVEVLRPFDNDLAARAPLPARANHGARAPIQDAAAAWLRNALDVVERGRVLVFDYTSPTTAALALRPWREWLRTYRNHERGEHYLAAAGHQDITADVALDQLLARAGEPDAVRPQQQFLRRWGIDELVAEGQDYWNEHAGRPGVQALLMRSRVREAEALLDPAGLGGFTAIEYARG